MVNRVPDDGRAVVVSHDLLPRVPVNILLVLQPPNHWGWIQVQTCSSVSPCLKIMRLCFVKQWDHEMKIVGRSNYEQCQIKRKEKQSRQLMPVYFKKQFAYEALAWWGALIIPNLFV